MSVIAKTERVLVRAIRYDDEYIYAMLPGCDVHQEIAIPKNIIDQYALTIMEVEIDEEGVYRFHVQCNIGAENAEDVTLSAPWEVE